MDEDEMTLDEICERRRLRRLDCIPLGRAAQIAKESGSTIEENKHIMSCEVCANLIARLVEELR